MNKRRVFLSISWGTIIFTTTWIVLLSFLITTPVYADNCLDDITNLADCMRTPVIREVITVGAGLLGVTPVVFVNLLSNLGALNPLPDLLSNITKSSTMTSILSDFWDRVKPVIQQFSPDLVKRIERYFARSAGSKLAERSSAILDALNKSSKSSSPSPSKQKTPVKGPTPVKVPSGGSGASGGSGGAGGSGGTGGKSGTPYKGPVKELDVKIFDGKDAHQILKALGLIKPGVPPEGQINVSRSDLDKLLGMHPSGDPIQLTLRSGKKVIINSVKGIAFDSDGVPGGDPGTLDFTKGISIAAEVVEPAPPPPPTPPGPGPGGAAPGGGSPGGAPGGKPGGGAAPGGSAPGGSTPGGKTPAGGKKPDSLMGQQFDGGTPQGGKSPSSDQRGSGNAGGAGGEGNVIDDQAASSATDDF